MSNKIKPNHYVLDIYANHEGERVLVETECGDILKALNQPFYVSNAIKYLWRAGKKDGESYRTDIEKAIQCLQEELKDEDTFDYEPNEALKEGAKNYKKHIEKQYNERPLGDNFKNKAIQIQEEYLAIKNGIEERKAWFEDWCKK